LAFNEAEVEAEEMEDSALRQKLDEIDPDSLTPREALQLLYDLKDLL
jgi:DNA mismatch repair ATPase MutS